MLGCYIQRFPYRAVLLSLLLLWSQVVSSVLPSYHQDRIHVYNILEEVPTNTFIANILMDSGLAVKYSPNIQSKLSFIFLKEIRHLELFALDERTGVLRTDRVIDRDVICPGQLNCMLRLDLAVQPSAYFEVIKVEITILDINDNSPSFDSPHFHLVIPESTQPGEKLLLPSASDVDSLPNGVIEYRLVSATSYFKLDVKNDAMGRPKEVWLVLLKDLDREQQEHFELIMAAYDGGIPRRSAMLTIAIQVGDINDNSPSFEKSTYNVSVSENTPIGATIVRLSASDADSGPNGHVRYRFSQRSIANYGDLFAIDPENGDVVLLQMLNHAPSNVYSLGVIAEDQGEFSSPALAALIVTVIDINDHTPQIIIDALSASGSVEVNENADIGTFVAHVSTYDKDLGDNGLVRCSINNSNFRLILIYDGEYKLVTARVFDRETVSRYEVVIRCHDMGEPRMYINKAIIVNVADVNDNHPVFTYLMYNATIQENLPWGSFLVRVSAHDPDEGANGEITYLLDSDADQRFHIDPDTGVITTLTGLDREVSEYVEFHVVAANKGEHNLISRALIHIHITDVDDESPKFLNGRYVFDVYENQPPKTEVGQVMAADRDLPPFDAFSFALRNSKIFGIDPKSGIIFTKKTLDREGQSQYEVSVEVLSNTVVLKHDNATVIINVLDVNDNIPNVTFPNELNHSVYVSSMFSVYDVVCTIRSHDLDVGVNSELSYETLEGNGTNFFDVDSVTGQLRLIRELLESVNETYLLVIKVRDGGVPAQFSTASLYITVVDGKLPVMAGLPRLQNHWLSDMRLMMFAGIAAICLVFIVLLATAIFLLRRRNHRRRAKARLAVMKKERLEQDDAKLEDDDADSLSKMKMMMNDGKMVRMKDISYIELSSDIPSNTSHKAPDESGSSGRHGVVPQGRQQVTSTPPTCLDPDTDSGCADVSHCNDDLSSGSERSSKDVDIAVGPKDRVLCSEELRIPCSSMVQVSDGHPNSAKTIAVVTSGPHPKQNDLKLVTSNGIYQSSSSFPSNILLSSANRKSVRFADSDINARMSDNFIDSRMSEETQKEVNVGSYDRKELGVHYDRERRVDGKVHAYAHQYPSHVAMTTFLPEEGSLV